MQFVTPDQLQQYVRFFITADVRAKQKKKKKTALVAYVTQARQLVTVIDQPFRAGDPSVTLIIRSKTGRYAWSCQSTTFDLSLSLLLHCFFYFPPPPIFIYRFTQFGVLGSWCTFFHSS